MEPLGALSVKQPPALVLWAEGLCPPQIWHVEILISKDGGISGWGLWEAIRSQGCLFTREPLWTGLGCLYRDPTGLDTPPTTWRNNQKPDSRKTALTCLRGHSDLGLPPSRAMRNTFVLFISHPVYGILLELPKQTDGGEHGWISKTGSCLYSYFTGNLRSSDMFINKSANLSPV